MVEMVSLWAGVRAKGRESMKLLGEVVEENLLGKRRRFLDSEAIW